ncbi:MAG: hypothetical protein JNK57_05080 [Planctomycetaceae bacterium]|nr:hypothetical protein [Planctomycetaceae bacterium]
MVVCNIKTLAFPQSIDDRWSAHTLTPIPVGVSPGSIINRLALPELASSGCAADDWEYMDTGMRAFD